MNFSCLLRLVPLLLIASPLSAGASGTRIWELAGFAELQKGELKGTVLSSVGEVGIGLSAEKVALEAGVGVVWTAAKNAAGDIYLGTGYDGKIFRLRGEEAVLVAETKQLVVTALAFDKAGDLYIGALPDPVIWKIAKPGLSTAKKPSTIEKWATLPEGTKHVWTLHFSKDNRVLFVGTGPEGKVFAVGSNRKAEVFADTEEEHILAAALEEDGSLLVGTSPSAMLLRVNGPGRILALADFEGAEVKAVVPYKKDIFVAVNDFKSPPAIPTKTAGIPETAKSPAAPAKAVVGDGEIYKVENGVRPELLWGEKKKHVTAMAVSKTGTLFAGLGADGKVISIDKENRIRVELDLDERQVMAVFADDNLNFAACGDAGAAYAVVKARKAEAVYLSPLLDASAVSEWGRADWLAAGRIKVQSRSGNTLTPGTVWSDWSGPLAKGDIISSPPARYLQFRFSWADDETAVLTSLQAAMKPANLRAVITEFDPGSPFPKPSGSDEETTSDRIIDSRPDTKIDSEIVFSWKVTNPDNDELRYRLWYRGEGEKIWRPILREDQVLSALRYVWKTESVPEGNYQIKLVADDSPINDPGDVMTDTFISPPILVDNHQPMIKALALRKNTVSGIAADTFSPIGAVDYSIDGGPWTPVSPLDRVFDEKEEAFSFSLPAGLLKGPHAAAVRTFDRGGNMGIAELHFTIE